MARVLEVCVDSVDSAETAARSGATRLELCANLVIGGTSPDEDLFCMVRERTDIPVRVLLRPRFGDFLYSDEEYELLRRQVRRFAALGADGVVIGLLRPDGSLDEDRMARLIDLADGCGVTLHRAFDVCRDPFEALEAARRLGVDTILTSGQQASCVEGAPLLAQLVEAASGRPQILVGAGVNAQVIRDLQPIIRTDAFHLSAKRTLESGMAFRRTGVPMGLPGMDEFTLWRCDGDAVRQARAALDALCPPDGSKEAAHAH